MSKFFILGGFRNAQAWQINIGGNKNVTDRDLRRDCLNELRPVSEIISRILLIYDRVKTKTSMLMAAETAHFTVACTCKGPHTNLRVVMGRNGIPKEIVGNYMCWYNQWFFMREQLEDPEERILRKWAERYVRWSPTKWSEPYLQGSFNRFARYCRLERAADIRNTAGRKTCVSIGLGDMQLPASKLPRLICILTDLA